MKNGSKAAFITILIFMVVVVVLEKRSPSFLLQENTAPTLPKKTFLSISSLSIAPWIQLQLEQNFQNIPLITKENIETTFAKISESITKPEDFIRYRIIDNRLYKYAPKDIKTSSRGLRYERAMVTLLKHTDISDIDCIFCFMDGIPDDTLTPQFFQTQNPEDQAPILAQAKLQNGDTDCVVLVPDQFALDENWYYNALEIQKLNNEITWEKKLDQVFWRGGFTDTSFPQRYLDSEEETPRMYLSRLSMLFPQMINAGITYAVVAEVEKKWTHEGLLKPGANNAEHMLYKYLPVLDGHMCTYPGYQWRLLSNSVCFKQESNQIQWFYHGLKPYEHYIPIANDLSDLFEKIQWANEHDDQVQKISQNAQEFAKEYLLYDKSYRYLSLVLQSYAKHQKIDFALMKQETVSSPDWIPIQ